MQNKGDFTEQQKKALLGLVEELFEVYQVGMKDLDKKNAPISTRASVALKAAECYSRISNAIKEGNFEQLGEELNKFVDTLGNQIKFDGLPNVMSTLVDKSISKIVSEAEKIYPPEQTISKGADASKTIYSITPTLTSKDMAPSHKAPAQVDGRMGDVEAIQKILDAQDKTSEHSTRQRVTLIPIDDAASPSRPPLKRTKRMHTGLSEEANPYKPISAAKGELTLQEQLKNWESKAKKIADAEAEKYPPTAVSQQPNTFKGKMVLKPIKSAAVSAAKQPKTWLKKMQERFSAGKKATSKPTDKSR